MYSNENFLELAIAFTSEQEITRIFDRILSVAMNLTNCDSGTVFLKHGKSLHLECMHTTSKNLDINPLYSEIVPPPTPLQPDYAISYSVLNKEILNIPNVYQARRFDLSGVIEFDTMNSYHTGSMLIIPMINDVGAAMGVLQLVNAIDSETGEVIPFQSEFENSLFAMTSLASVALHNRILSKENSDVLHSLVRVIINVIDSRSPYNTNHTKTMVNYATRFLYWQEMQYQAGKHPQPFLAEEFWDPFLLSIWLHDLGKLLTPISILDKRTRLGNRQDAVLSRIEVAMLAEKIVYLENQQVHPEEAEAALSRIEDLKDARELILDANEGHKLSSDQIKEIRRVGAIPCRHSNGSYTSLLTEDELDALTVRRGTLSAAERKIVEKHVAYTESMLHSMVFSGSYTDVPKWASGHHERLDGTGYPHQKTGPELCKETRFITILDIYDTLTAEDRPYKPAIPPAEAFRIMRDMADEGKIDGDLLELFEESKAWD